GGGGGAGCGGGESGAGAALGHLWGGCRTPGTAAGRTFTRSALDLGAAGRGGSSPAARCGAPASHAPDCAPSVCAAAATTRVTGYGLAAGGTRGGGGGGGPWAPRPPPPAGGAAPPPPPFISGKPAPGSSPALLRMPPRAPV